MAATRGDGNAILKDLTIIAEDTVAETRPPLYPLIASNIPEDGAYTKIPVPANVAFPRKLEGERAQMGKDVNVVQTYNQDTYELTIDIDSDLLLNSKAYTYADLVREGAMSAVLFPDYMMSQAVINGATSGFNGYDGNTYYGATHTFAKMGSNNINNTVSATGQTVTQLYTDLASALKSLRTFLDNQGRLLNPLAAMGADRLVVHCPVALEIPFRQLVQGSMVPVSAPVTTSGTAAMPVANNVLQGAATIYADGYLDANSSTAWYLHYIGMAQRPFVFIQNYPIQTQVLGYGSEFEKQYNKVRISFKHRFVIGYYRFDRSIKVS